MANAVLESDEENRPSLDYETGSEADEAEAILVEAERAYKQEVSEDTTRQLVRARRRVPLGRIDPYPSHSTRDQGIQPKSGSGSQGASSYPPKTEVSRQLTSRRGLHLCAKQGVRRLSIRS
jgi:hypothetical protein